MSDRITPEGPLREIEKHFLPVDIRVIQRYLRLQSGKFGILPLCVDTPADARALQEWLKQQGYDSPTVQATDIESNPLAHLEEHPELSRNKIVVINDFTEALKPEHSVPIGDRSLIFNALNVQRDQLRDKFPIIWILIFVGRNQKTQYLLQAPDFADFGASPILSAKMRKEDGEE